MRRRNGWPEWRPKAKNLPKGKEIYLPGTGSRVTPGGTPMLEPRDALEAIGNLPDTEIDIGNAALQFARIDAPDADWQAARGI